MSFPRIAHVALTVADLERSIPWYRQLFGADPVLEEDTGRFRHAVWVLGDTLVGLHQVPDGLDDVRFDERRPGLDHLSFACADKAELAQWAARLDELGIRHGGIEEAGYGFGLSFRAPDGLPLGFFAFPA